jgi:hypothetical protein
MENEHHANINHKKARVSILISDRADIKARKIIRNGEKYYDKGVNSSIKYNNP